MSKANIKFHKASDSLKALEELNGYILNKYKLLISLNNPNDSFGKYLLEPFKIKVKITKKMNNQDLICSFKVTL